MPRKQSQLHGQALVRRLVEEVDFLPVIRTAVLEMGLGSSEAAFRAMDAFLQWFSLIPLSHRIDHYVMLRGDVDRLWHAMILNTALYRKVCRHYLGRFVDHHASTGCPLTAWVLETVDFIEAEFGAALHPAFLEWRARASAEAASGEGDALAVFELR